MPDENDILYNQYSLDWSEFLRVIIGFFTNSDITVTSILSFLQNIWVTFVVLSLLFAALCLFGYIYAALRYNELSQAELDQVKAQERLYQELYGTNQPTRFDDIKAHVLSDNPNDWKLAIIEADIELEQLLKNAGYPGATVGEKLKNANPQSFTTLQDAWAAHKTRNRIAHDGADFVVTKKIAQDTINQYQRVFAEFGHT